MGRAGEKARPKDSGFSSGSEPALHAERQMESRVETDAEDATVAAGDLLIVVREVHAEQAEAQVRTEDVAELRRVSQTAHVGVPDPGREVRLDAEPGGGQGHADAHRTDHARRCGTVGGGGRAGRGGPQVYCGRA